MDYSFKRRETWATNVILGEKPGQWPNVVKSGLYQIGVSYFIQCNHGLLSCYFCREHDNLTKLYPFVRCMLQVVIKSKWWWSCISQNTDIFRRGLTNPSSTPVGRGPSSPKLLIFMC